MKKKLELKKETVASLGLMNNLRGGTGPTPTLENCPVEGPTVAVGCEPVETVAVTCGNQTKYCSLACTLAGAGCATKAGATCEGGDTCMVTGRC